MTMPWKDTTNHRIDGGHHQYCERRASIIRVMMKSILDDPLCWITNNNQHWKRIRYSRGVMELIIPTRFNPKSRWFSSRGARVSLWASTTCIIRTGKEVITSNHRNPKKVREVWMTYSWKGNNNYCSVNNCWAHSGNRARLNWEGHRFAQTSWERSSPKTLGDACCIAFWFETLLTNEIKSWTTSWFRIMTKQQWTEGYI